jgi:hypothetical protein
MHIENGNDLQLKHLVFLERIGAEMEADGDARKVRIYV